MVKLTCINHPELRWSCKGIAVTDGKYNGSRNIFFLPSMNAPGTEECDCPSADLRELGYYEATLKAYSAERSAGWPSPYPNFAE